ncbi:MAG: bifunctional 4'-phosphopantothenoylcysteine decarboxylase/phosphopantothenoylcysteine synthetase [Candidatus Reconcilbacillus cellulovorans]|uniref:Coenzyme A biosynthesis bifunctional protein CoaBC n=1 Tax=Candidatus Reconcilbacillus cellulovorans TaxID=1906605 RepID=A0A2A6E4T8_9BACL|nr:MAG: bifunctional 4'-phosphopantothenoylcysteine decarboxylase/phosphopantothenoylcysteine synthetase [Candidatus Reconcilbacillus cellulovorans]
MIATSADRERPLVGRTIVLGVSGGIAAYKAAALCSRLTQAGARVRVVMTEAATRFVTPLTFQALSGHDVAVGVFEERDPSVIAHIDLAEKADLFVVAPATADVLAKMAHGFADDMLTAALLAARSPVLVCPSMNVHMYRHPAVEANMRLLRERGIRFVEPDDGPLACGYVGKGRLAEPEKIVEAVVRLLAPSGPLAGKRVLVTAGGTVERLDPVRYIGNDSSGKMGYAIAAAARDRGARVVLVSGKASVAPPEGVELVRAESAEDMFAAVRSRWEETDVLIKAAAVADFRPKMRSDSKLKKKDKDVWTVELVRNPDIAEWAGRHKDGRLIVLFAAETDDVQRNAVEKLRRKNGDLIVVNDVTEPGAGFGSDTNRVDVYDADGLVASLPLLPKREVAERLLSLIEARLNAGRGADSCTRGSS